MQAKIVSWYVAALNLLMGDFPGGPAAKTPCSQCKGLRFKPGQEAGSHVLQLRPSTAKYVTNNNNKKNSSTGLNGIKAKVLIRSQEPL